MTKINLERRAEIGREKRARTKAQLTAAAKALFSKRPWESVTIDEVVHEARVAKGTFYGHFNDLDELASAVADELIRSFDELIQPQRLSLTDPLVRIAFGCDAFIAKALEDRSWASLTARMARSHSAVGQVARSRLSEDLQKALKQSPQVGLSPELAVEAALGIMIQVIAAIGDGRLEESDRAEAIRCILAAIGVGRRDATSIINRLAGIRSTSFRPASEPRAAMLRKPSGPLKQPDAARH